MTAFETVPCSECGRPIDEHTVAMHFEPVEHPVMRGANGEVLADHLDLAATYVKIDRPTGPLFVPGVQFKFGIVGRGPAAPPIVRAAEMADTLKQLGRLMLAACDLAPTLADQAKREHRRSNGS